MSPRIEAALADLKTTIAARYPEARFEVGRAEDEPENVHLTVTVDLDDPDQVLDLVIDRLVELQVEERLPIHVIPIRTPERVVASMLEQGRPGHYQRRAVPLIGSSVAPGP
jgi:hypothetical protein